MSITLDDIPLHEDLYWEKCQQVGREGEVVVGAKLRLEGKLGQGQGVDARAGHDDERGHDVVPGTQCREDRHRRVHGHHKRKDDPPVRGPGGGPVHARGLLEGNRNVLEVPRVQENVHRHVEHGVEQDDTHDVVEML